MTRPTSSTIHSPHSRTLQSLMPSWLEELVSVPTNPCVVEFSPPIAVRGLLRSLAALTR